MSAAPWPRAVGLTVAAALALTAPLPRWGAPPTLPAARAAEAWRDEFERICARTQDAMTLSTDELRALVAAADALLPRIEQLGESERKVYGRRLKACRNLYAFMLETREEKR